MATVEITSIGPADEPDHSATSSIAAARSLVTGALLTPGCSAVEIRYVTTGATGPDPSRIRMFVTAKSYGATDLSRAAAVQSVVGAARALPPDWIAEPATHPGLDQTARETIWELRCPEEVTSPLWSHVKADFFYSVHGVRGDGSGWRSFWTSLARQSVPVCLSLLFRRTQLDPLERDVLGGITSELAYYAETRQDYNLIGNPYVAPGDANAARALDAWRARIDALREPVLARFAVRARADVAAYVSGALAAALAGRADSSPDGEVHPMRIESPLNADDSALARLGFDALEVVPWGGHDVWKMSGSPVTLRRMPYLFGIHETASLAIVPVADPQGAPGFPMTRPIDTVRAAVGVGTEDGVLLGHAIDRGARGSPVTLPPAAVNRHVLVSGSSGSGKTTTVMTLLADLWSRFQVPFLVLETVKTEYRSLLEVPGLEALKVVTLGRDDVSPLRFNPLDPPPGVRCESHQTSVMAALKLALPLDQPLPLLLEEALERCFTAAGWELDDTRETAPPAPTLRDLLASFSTVFEEKQYAGDARNIAPAVQVRLRSLLRGSKGRVLDTVESTDFSTLLLGPAVIELDGIEDPEEKSLFAALILDRVRAEARRRGSAGGQLRHVTVLEEAHRVLPFLGTATTGADGGVRAAVVDSYANAMAELRASGEGFVICSQSPARLARSAVTLTGTRIIHRLEDDADRRALLADLDASESDQRIAARLVVGEAIARWPQRDEPVLIRVSPAPGVDSGQHVDTESVSNRMQDFASINRALLPFALCTRTVCEDGCDVVTRRLGNTIATQLESKVRRRVESDRADPTAEIVRAAIDQGAQTPQELFCVASHLRVRQAAFVSVPGAIDHRDHIRSVIDEELTHA